MVLHSDRYWLSGPFEILEVEPQGDRAGRFFVLVKLWEYCN